MTVPVLFLIFNRPDQTSTVFDAIRRAQPPRLYVAADGARPDSPADIQKCQQARAIVSSVNWPCEVHYLFRDNNLGCKRSVAEAISWFFTNEPEGIILEDDCLPCQSFFWFCQELLEKYRHDERIWQICGTRMLVDSPGRDSTSSYIFSRYGPIWGWASWRRAWSYYDSDLAAWPVMRRAPLLHSAYANSFERRFRRHLGDRLYRCEFDTWDYQWVFTRHYQSGLAIIPRHNLILNIGFGASATHTKRRGPSCPTVSEDIEFPLTHPRYVLADSAHDTRYRQTVLLGSCLARLKRVLNGMFVTRYRLPERHLTKVTS